MFMFLMRYFYNVTGYFDEYKQEIIGKVTMRAYMLLSLVTSILIMSSVIAMLFIDIEVILWTLIWGLWLVDISIAFWVKGTLRKRLITAIDLTPGTLKELKRYRWLVTIQTGVAVGLGIFIAIMMKNDTTQEHVNMRFLFIVIFIASVISSLLIYFRELKMERKLIEEEEENARS